VGWDCGASIEKWRSSFAFKGLCGWCKVVEKFAVKRDKFVFIKKKSVGILRGEFGSWVIVKTTVMGRI
jgi:hypothetical protein